jgi:predicted nuclease of predicted toxin-antitoxin system
MKFLCDVHISYKLVNAILNLGFDCIHVNTIIDKWYSKDADIATFADHNNYIIITKDSDFRNSFYINKTPKKLIKINLGNITNIELIKIVSENIEKFNQIANAYSNFIIEIDTENINFVTLDSSLFTSPK